MDETTLTETTPVVIASAPTTPATTPAAHVIEELLVEELSIDGMCGVY